MKRILITGGNGFIGSALTEKLRSDYTVTVLDVSLSRNPFEDVTYVQGNFANKDLLRQVLPGHNMVIHLAHSTVPSNSVQDPVFDIETNVIGTLHLMQCMEEYGVKNLIYMSSGGAVYGTCDEPVTEDHPLNPVSNYGIGKATTEFFIRQFQGAGRLNSVILRPSNIYGPRKDKIGQHGVISTILHCLKNEKPFYLWGSDQIVKDYLYIDDFCDLVMKVCADFKPGTYNVGSGVGVSIRQIIEAFEKVSDKKLEVIAQGEMKNDVWKIALDSSKLLSCYPTFNKQTLIKGIATMYQKE
jgi:UDP-glucose 4-epimerase